MTGGSSGNGRHVCMCARAFHNVRAPRALATDKAGAAITARPSLVVSA